MPELNPDGIANLLTAIFRQLHRDLASVNERKQYDARCFCRSSRCRLFVESAGGDWEAWLKKVENEKGR